jgi:hypothetical protein
MFHCHIALHEDESMMGQFVVTNTTGINDLKNIEIPISIYPNPTNNTLFIQFNNSHQSAYYITITDALGRTKLMLPKPDLTNGIDISQLNKGVYHISIVENTSKQTVTKTFVVN